MAILRPNQLPPATTPLSATDLVVVDQGAGGVNAADPQDVVDAVAPVVSQANAEAGLNNNDRMTAFRTKQSIAAEVGVTIASAAQGSLASTAVQPTRQVIAGSGLTGGGSLSADVTLNVGAGAGISVAADTVGLDANTQSRLLIGGGTTSQVLQKSSNSDYDVAWATVAAATAVSYAPQTLTGGEQLQARTNIGLSNVNNTSDANKPISTATQSALDLKAPLDISGLTAKATPVDADLVGIGDSAASFSFKKLTFANLKAWVQSWLPFTKYYESAEQTITLGATFSLTHAMGVKPKVVEVSAICKTADGGVLVGEEIPVRFDSAGVAAGYGATPVWDATTIKIRVGNTGPFLFLSTAGAVIGPTSNANWRYIVRAWA